jgi:hypothetical protein
MTQSTSPRPDRSASPRSNSISTGRKVVRSSNHPDTPLSTAGARSRGDARREEVVAVDTEDHVRAGDLGRGADDDRLAETDQHGHVLFVDGDVQAGVVEVGAPRRHRRRL